MEVERTPPDLESTASLKRNQLLDSLGQHIFNDLPARLIRISDMKILSRSDLWDDLHICIKNLSNADLLALPSPKEDVFSRVRYAIFSHRWGAHEPSYQQLTQNEAWMDDHTLMTSPGLLKLIRFCDKARVHGCAYAWSDTCCIDKSSSAELEEAIRSMYRWYRDAQMCIVHLAATDSLADFEHEPWFRRGWTLQELLAPKRIVFYNKGWSPVSAGNVRRDAETRNDKEDWRVLGAISKETGIPAGDLRYFNPSCERVSEKMKWASRRETTRTEDVAYSLIGIFDITMPISYGEGPWAFHRLMEGIAQRCSEPGFFAWAGDASPYSLALPSSPASYGMLALDSQTATGLRLTGSLFEEVGDTSYSITKLGLQIKLLLLPARWVQNVQSTGNYTLSFSEGTFLETLPSPSLSQAYYEIFKPEQCVLGVLNYTRVEGNRGLLRVGEYYFCLLLRRSGEWSYVKARTDMVLVWKCVEGAMKDLEDVCLLNMLGCYDRDEVRPPDTNIT
ncbi:hypothetical protein JVU11DRAFT_2036 [Chiua virens]|nr:hypothetical protein JVU11DRAFT_2036 [Chiua virens]